MATREENLKKINEQLEKLDDEQLEQIAGGGIYMIDPKNPNADPIKRLYKVDPENVLRAGIY